MCLKNDKQEHTFMCPHITQETNKTDGHAVSDSDILPSCFRISVTAGAAVEDIGFMVMGTV